MNSTVEDLSTPEHQKRREGWQSSEFWLSIAVVALPILLPLLDSYAGRLPQGSWQAVIAGAIVAAGYSVSRGIVKKSRNDSSAVESAAKINADATMVGLDFETMAKRAMTTSINQALQAVREKKGIGQENYAMPDEPAYIDQTPRGPEGNDFP